MKIISNLTPNIFLLIMFILIIIFFMFGKNHEEVEEDFDTLKYKLNEEIYLKYNKKNGKQFYLTLTFSDPKQFDTEPYFLVNDFYKHIFLQNKPDGYSKLILNQSNNNYKLETAFNNFNYKNPYFNNPLAKIYAEENNTGGIKLKVKINNRLYYVALSDKLFTDNVFEDLVLNESSQNAINFEIEYITKNNDYYFKDLIFMQNYDKIRLEESMIPYDNDYDLISLANISINSSSEPDDFISIDGYKERNDLMSLDKVT